MLTANITFIYILSNLFDSPATKYSFLVSTPAEAKAFSSGLVWSNAITSVASGLAALMAVALRFLSRYSATVRVTRKLRRIGKQRNAETGGHANERHRDGCYSIAQSQRKTTLANQ